MGADLITFAGQHWHSLAGLVGGGGILTFGGRHVYKRLQPDQQACVDALEHLEAAADAIESIVGRPDTVAADCDRARAANRSRRRAGTLIKDLYPGEKFDSFRTLLSNVDQKLMDVEDCVTGGVEQKGVRAACDEVRVSIHQTRRAFRNRSGQRLSVILFGRRKFSASDKE